VETGLRDLDALIAWLQKHPAVDAAPRIRKVR
jgi:5'-nucleotidase